MYRYIQLGSVDIKNPLWYHSLRLLNLKPLRPPTCHQAHHHSSWLEMQSLRQSYTMHRNIKHPAQGMHPLWLQSNLVYVVKLFQLHSSCYKVLHHIDDTPPSDKTEPTYMPWVENRTHPTNKIARLIYSFIQNLDKINEN